MKSHAAAHPLPRSRPQRRSLPGTLVDRFLLLPMGAAIALVWANTDPESYFRVSLPLAFVVNEIGMAFFFALITQEVVEAMMPGGALHSWRRWSLALVAAAGGVIGAAVIYFGYLNVKHEALLLPYWPIASAIDMAVAYYTLKVILPRSGALPFLLLLGITTNIFGIVEVAPRFQVLNVYSGGVTLLVGALGLATLLRAVGVRAFWPYLAV